MQQQKQTMLLNYLLVQNVQQNTKPVVYLHTLKAWGMARTSVCKSELLNYTLSFYIYTTFSKVKQFLEKNLMFAVILIKNAVKTVTLRNIITTSYNIYKVMYSCDGTAGYDPSHIMFAAKEAFLINVESSCCLILLWKRPYIFFRMTRTF